MTNIKANKASQPAGKATIVDDKTLTENSPSVLQPFEQSFDEYVKAINNNQTEKTKQYQQLLNEYNERFTQASNDLIKEKQEITARSNDALNEAYKNNAERSALSEIQTQAFKDLSDIQQKEYKLVEDLNKELNEKVMQLSEAYKKDSGDAFVKHHSNFAQNLLELKQDSTNPNSLYNLGYMLMLSASYGHATT